MIYIPTNQQNTIRDLMLKQNNPTSLIEMRKLLTYQNQNGGFDTENFMKMKAFKRMFDHFNNIFQSIFEANFETNKKLDELIKIQKGMSEDIEDADVINDFDDEQKEREQKKREEKQINILEKILTSLSMKASSALWESDNQKDFFGLGGLGNLGTLFFGNKIIKGIAGSKIFKGLASFAPKLVGGLGAVFGIKSFYEGIINSEDIMGELLDPTKFEDLPKVLGVGFSKLMSDLTFGIFKDKDIYTFLTDGFPKTVKDYLFVPVKNVVLSTVESIDAATGNFLSKVYERIKKKIEESEPTFEYIEKESKGLLDWLGLGIIARDIPEMPKKTYEAFAEAAANWGKLFGDNWIVNWLEGLETAELGERATSSASKMALANTASRFAKQKPKDYFKGHETLSEYANKPYCGAGVTDITSKTFNTPRIQRPKAAQLAEAFESDKNFIEQTAGWSLNYDQLKRLEAGNIVVFGNLQNGKLNLKDPGHATITLGNNQSYSDKLEPDFAAEVERNRNNGRQFRVFSPQYIENTRGPQITKSQLATKAKQVNLQNMNTTNSEEEKVNQFVKQQIKQNKPNTIQSESTQPVVNNIYQDTQMLMPEDMSTSISNSIDGILFRSAFNILKGAL